MQQSRASDDAIIAAYLAGDSLAKIQADHDIKNFRTVYHVLERNDVPRRVKNAASSSNFYNSREDRILREMAAKGFRTRDIAKELRRSERSVSVALWRRKLRRSREVRSRNQGLGRRQFLSVAWSPEHEFIATDLWLSGAKLNEIGDLLNRAPAGVRDKLGRLGAKRSRAVKRKAPIPVLHAVARFRWNGAMVRQIGPDLWDVNDEELTGRQVIGRLDWIERRK